MSAPALHVTHVLRNLRVGGIQNGVLLLIKALPAFRHSVVSLASQAEDLDSEYGEVAELRRCSYGRRGRVDFVRRLARRIGELEPDAVIGHFFGNHVLVACAARLAGVQATFGVAANDPVDYEGSRWKALLLAQAGRPFCSGVVSVSESVGRVLTSKLHLPAAHVHVIRNGVAVEEIASQAQSARAARRSEPAGPSRVLMAARLGRHRDHATLLRAMQILHDGEAPELWLAGPVFEDGTAFARAEGLTAALGLQQRVRFLGSRRDVPSLMGSCDLVVQSTLTEGLGNAVLEAMAAGVPVVATDVPSCREVLDGGRCGLLVALEDPAALAAAIRRLLADQALRRRLTQAAFERVRANFDVTTMASGYAELLGRVHARPAQE